MDVIDRFQSGLFVPQLNLNTGYIPPPQLSRDKEIYPPADQSIALPTPRLESSQEIPLPLLSVSIDVDLNGRLSTTKVTQKFTNATASATQNARYLFPIYNGSVVASFKCWIGPDKLLEGDVKPKEVARADFQQAVSRHKAAVLVEEVTPEIFETNLGNIPAQTTVKVEIAYTGLLKVDISTGGLVLNIPTSVAPRYGSAPDEYSAADPLPTEGLRVSIHASMPAAIRKMESGTHPISVEIGAVSHRSFQTFAAGASSETFDPSKARANLADRSAALHRDFILYITLSSPREFMQSQAVATSHPEIPGQSTVAITINPGNLFLQMVNPDDFNGEIIFMADRSGSMQSNIPSLIDVMNVFLRSLPQQCSFNIASFGSSVSWLWPVSNVYDQDQLDIATRHVAAFQANLGGTEILSALQSVLDHHNKGLDVPTNVILLTDGEVWDVDKVIRFVRNTASDRNANIRFFALGIGDRVSHRLVEGIGQQGGGCAEIVAESSPGSWQGRVIQMLKAALTPPRLRCDVTIGEWRPATTGTFEASKISDYILELPPCIQAPHHIPMLNAFSQFSLYYMLECELDALPETVTVTGVTDKGEKLTAQLPLQKFGYQSGVHHLAAKALMNDYETGQSWLHAANSALRSNEPEIFDRLLAQEAQRLGQQWSITSKWTSFVAIDRDTARRHEISLWKADGVDVSELTRPRKIRTVPALPMLRSPSHYHKRGSRDEISAEFELFGSHMGGWLSSTAMTSDSKGSCVHNEPYVDFLPTQMYGASVGPVSEDKSSREPPMVPEDPTNVFSLSRILYSQGADGEIRLYGTNLQRPLIAQFKTVIHFANQSAVSDQHHELCSVDLNVLAVVYITIRYATLRGLWELQVAKARRWIQQQLAELLYHSESNPSGQEFPEMALEKLERMARVELLDDSEVTDNISHDCN